MRILVADPFWREVTTQRLREGLVPFTGSLQRVHVAANTAQLESLGNRLYAQIRALAGASLAGSLTIHDEMAPDITLLPGTADGSPLEGPDWLIWRLDPCARKLARFLAFAAQDMGKIGRSLK